MSDIVSSAAPPLPNATEKLRFYGMWLVAALVLALLPKVFGSGTALTTFSLVGISIIFSLSYNILLGQTGLLSFGHAVYYGLGGFLVIHAINIIGGNKLPIPLPVVPLIGGLAGLFFAVLLGWVSTQRSGTAFAMISLGVAELIASSALILRTFFGGEAGVSANRTKLFRIFGWSFGPQIQIYYLVARRSGACATPCATIPSASSSSATIRMSCAIWHSASPAFSPVSRARLPRSISRSPTRPTSAPRNPARCCMRPISAASASSSGPSSARSSLRCFRWA
jgi:hypothetical protein